MNKVVFVFIKAAFPLGNHLVQVLPVKHLYGGKLRKVPHNNTLYHSRQVRLILRQPPAFGYQYGDAQSGGSAAGPVVLGKSHATRSGKKRYRHKGV